MGGLEGQGWGETVLTVFPFFYFKKKGKDCVNKNSVLIYSTIVYFFHKKMVLLVNLIDQKKF